MDDLKKIINKYFDSHCLSESVYQILKEAIIENVIPAGERIVEDNIAKMFDVSRTPVREVVKRLEMEGFLCHSPKFGFVVKEHTLNDCLLVVEALEYLRQITTRIAAKDINSIAISRLQFNLEETKEKYEKKEDVVKLLNGFHDIIANSISNTLLVDNYNSLAEQHTLMLNRYGKMEINPLSIIEHEAILGALEKHDEEKAWELELIHSKKALISRAKRFVVK